MNTGQKNLHDLMLDWMKAGKSSLEREYEFLVKCHEAWEGFDDSCYSYPHWQLRALEAEYGLTVAGIKEQIELMNKHQKSDPRETAQVVREAVRKVGWERVRDIVYSGSTETVGIANFINSRMFADEIITKLKNI